MSLSDSRDLGINGGVPVRRQLLPYARPCVEEDDIAAVVQVLRSDFLTTGPKVAEFESAFANIVSAKHAVAVSSGTAALHCIVNAFGIGPGDEVIIPAMTFAATATAVLMEGGTPVFADVEPDTLLIDIASVERRITSRTRAIIAVDYGGQPASYGELRELASRKNLHLIADACHSLGALYQGKPAATFADATAFSTHPVKHIATGEGGLVTTDNDTLAEKMRRFRNHGISLDHRHRGAASTWFYEISALGMNYRLSDIHCALGLNQLKKLSKFLERRYEIAAFYQRELPRDAFSPLGNRPDRQNAYHLYVVQTPFDRKWLFSALRAEGIGVNVHYVPAHLHPLFRERLGTAPGLCPVAEQAYERIVSLPMFPQMTKADQQDVIAALRKVSAALV